MDIEYGLFLYEGSLLIYEGGSYRGYFGSYVATDRFRVGVEDGVVRYRQNGVVFYESPTPVQAEQYPLVAGHVVLLGGLGDERRGDRGGSGGRVAAADRDAAGGGVDAPRWAGRRRAGTT